MWKRDHTYHVMDRLLYYPKWSQHADEAAVESTTMPIWIYQLQVALYYSHNNVVLMYHCNCSMDEVTDLSFNSNFRVTVYSDGNVAYAPGFQWKTSCELDLKYFPFDHQVSPTMTTLHI